MGSVFSQLSQQTCDQCKSHGLTEIGRKYTFGYGADYYGCQNGHEWTLGQSGNKIHFTNSFRVKNFSGT